MEEENQEQRIAEDITLKEAQPEQQAALSLSAEAGGGTDQRGSTHAQGIFDVGPEYELIKRHAVFVNASWAVIFFFLALTMCMYCYASMVAWPWQMSWPAVQGHVIKADRLHHRTCRYEYEYVVDGKTFSGTVHKSASLYFTVKENAAVTVRYNPKSITESYMQSGFNIVETPFYGIVAALLLLASHLFARGKFNQWQYKTFPIDESKRR